MARQSKRLPAGRGDDSSSPAAFAEPCVGAEGRSGPKGYQELADESVEPLDGVLAERP